MGCAKDPWTDGRPWHCVCSAGSMDLTIRCSHWVFALFAITCVAVSATAQGVNAAEPLPNISRVCLWNADRDTWKELGLKKAQIERMRQLRLFYPAVVDGQWILVDDGVPIIDEPQWTRSGSQRRISTGRGTSAATTQAGRRAKTTVPQEGLQNDVREVLTPKQLRKWALLCAQ